MEPCTTGQNNSKCSLNPLSSYSPLDAKLNPLLQTCCPFNTIGHALSALVKNDDAKMLAQGSQESTGIAVLSHDFQVGNDAGQIQQVAIAMAEDLLGNAQFAREKELGFRLVYRQHGQSPKHRSERAASPRSLALMSKVRAESIENSRLPPWPASRLVILTTTSSNACPI